MLDLILNFFSVYLIEFMAGMLVTALVFRWVTWKSSKKEDEYFSAFTSEVEKLILLRKENKHDVNNIEDYIENLLNDVKSKLPTRNIRNKSKNINTAAKAKSLGAKNVVSLREFVDGDQSLYLGIKAEMASFKSKFPPNFNLLTERILEKDNNWNKVLKFFPVGPVSRLIDILPGLFVVFGIFGTFLGISMALPQIAKIDFNNLDASGDILSAFVLSVTFAMKTSIAGILFSLSMTLLNTIAPVKGLRIKTLKKISNSFESIWQSIHGNKTMEQELHSVLPNLLIEVTNIRKELAKTTKHNNGIDENDKFNKVG